MWIIVFLFFFSIWCVVSPFLPKERKPAPQVLVVHPKVIHNVIHTTVYNFNEYQYSIYAPRAQSHLPEPKYVYPEEGFFRDQNKN